MLNVSDISATLQQNWATNAPANLPIQFPGVPLDASKLDTWCEFWLTSIDDLTRRFQHNDFVHIVADLHCFSRQPDKRAIFDIADHFRTELSQTNIPIINQQDQQQVGLLRFREATLRDMTRQADTQPHLPVQHLVISTIGIAEELL